MAWASPRWRSDYQIRATSNREKAESPVTTGMNSSCPWAIEHTIEGIAVISLEGAGSDGVRDGDRQRCHAGTRRCPG